MNTYVIPLPGSEILSSEETTTAGDFRQVGINVYYVLPAVACSVSLHYNVICPKVILSEVSF